MSRMRDFRRMLRRKMITRKKRICREKYLYPDWYRFDGQYDKGKIHCSCRMCREKDARGRHILTRHERNAIRTMREELSSYRDSDRRRQD